MATHQFQPDHYFSTIGSHPPVLRVQPGDSIETTTVDARGQDSSGQPVTSGGNPMTGPFYVDGAEPGDTLVVHLDKLLCNRPYGWTRTMVAPNVVDPEQVPNMPWPAEGQELANWRVDNEAGTVTLEEPQTTLGALTLPLAPMPGCFGVAPDRGEAISTATSGPFGGNMDYRGFVEGVTVYLPVFVPRGALSHR